MLQIRGAGARLSRCTGGTALAAVVALTIGASGVGCGPAPAKHPNSVATALPQVSSSAPPSAASACAPGTMRDALSNGECRLIQSCSGDDVDCDAKCDAGDNVSCDVLARRALQEKAYDRAEAAWDKGCALHDVLSCESAGYAALLRADLSVEEKHRAARDSFVKGCALMPMECERAARYFVWGPAREPEKALPLLEKACAGWQPSCVELATYYLRFKGDHTSAEQTADKACDHDSSGMSCARFGEYLETGDEGVPNDPVKALGYLERGCAKGDKRGCVGLGFAYREGLGVSKDATKARQAFLDACDRSGVSTSDYNWTCVFVAEAFEEGVGGPKELAKAIDIYAPLCERGVGMACMGEARLLDKGVPPGVPRAVVRAAMLYERACDKAYGVGDIGLRLSREACDRAAAELEKKDKSKVEAFWKGRCEQRADAHACARVKALGGTLATTLVTKLSNERERECKHGPGESCRIWKELGGAPSPAELKQPITPWSLPPPPDLGPPEPWWWNRTPPPWWPRPPPTQEPLPDTPIGSSAPATFGIGARE